MMSNSVNNDQIEGIQDDWNNAIILPDRKKSGAKGMGKVSKKKQAPPISKSKLKKVKKLQKEKEKKLLQIKSIKILEKHKIWDGAYSLLQSSGTIGQAETVKEKRRRVVQLSKAGLEVPEDLSPLKKKGKRSTPCDEETNLNFDSGQSYQQNASSDNDLKMTKCLEVDDCKHNLVARVHLETISKISIDADVGSYAVTPSKEIIHKNNDNIAKDQNSTQSISCSCDEGSSTKLQIPKLEP